MKKILQFMRTNIVFKTVILCASFVFPCICITYMGNGRPIAFYYVWIAFYSSLLVCISYKSKAVKIMVCGLNSIFVVGITLLFLMGGAEIIPGVIWNAVVPFLPNPWFE